MKRCQRRKKKLVGRLQCRFVGFLLGYFMLTMVTLVAVLVGPPVVQLIVEDGDFAKASAAATQLLYMHSVLWPAIAGVLILFVVHSVIFSHRIAGPLLRIRRLLSDIGAGDLGMEVRIRRKDLLHEEVDALNGMLQGLQRKVVRLDEACRRARAAAEHLDRQGEEQEHARAELHTAIEDIRACLSQFQLASPAATDTGAGGDDEGNGAASGSEHREEALALGPARTDV